MFCASKKARIHLNVLPENLSSRDTPTRRHPVLSGPFLRMVSYLLHINEGTLATSGHCLEVIEMSLKTGFTVLFCSHFTPNSNTL